MADFIVVAIVVVLLGAAVSYIIKEKKRGAVCIGCPHAGQCAKKCQGSCGSHADTDHQ